MFIISCVTAVHQWASDVCKLPIAPACWCTLEGRDCNVSRVSLRDQPHSGYSQFGGWKGHLWAADLLPILRPSLPAWSCRSSWDRTVPWQVGAVFALTERQLPELSYGLIVNCMFLLVLLCLLFAVVVVLWFVHQQPVVHVTTTLKRCKICRAPDVITTTLHRRLKSSKFNYTSLFRQLRVTLNFLKAPVTISFLFFSQSIAFTEGTGLFIAFDAVCYTLFLSRHVRTCAVTVNCVWWTSQRPDKSSWVT